MQDKPRVEINVFRPKGTPFHGQFVELICAIDKTMTTNVVMRPERTDVPSPAEQISERVNYWLHNTKWAEHMPEIEALCLAKLAEFLAAE